MADMLSYFMGRDGFTWFIGVCEDRDDPKAIGRIRVRCFGYHTDDLTKLPTQDLPWAHVILPPTAQVGAMHNIRPGDWVFGFFRDTDTLQQPVIIGVMPGIPSTASDPSKGFSDPNSPSAPDTQDTKYKKEPDFGPYPSRVGQADTSRLTSGLLEAHPEIAERDLADTKDVPTAKPDVTWSDPRTTDPSEFGLLAAGTNPETGEARTPKLRRGTEYPYNHVLETEGGHIKEYDDTPYAERIYEKHTAGTFYEIDADGNKVTRVVGDNYEIVAGTNYVNVKGDVNLTIDSNCNTYIKGDWNIKVDGNVNETIGGNQTTAVTGNIDIDAAKIDLN